MYNLRKALRSSLSICFVKGKDYKRRKTIKFDRYNFLRFYILFNLFLFFTFSYVKLNFSHNAGINFMKIYLVEIKKTK